MAEITPYHFSDDYFWDLLIRDDFNSLPPNKYVSILVREYRGQPWIHQIVGKGSMNFLNTVLLKLKDELDPKVSVANFLQSVRDFDFASTLHRAAQKASLESFKLLCDTYECNPSQVSRDNWPTTCLHFASEAGRIDIVEYLIECHQMDPTRHVGILTPLHYACRGGSLELVRAFLVKYKCDPWAVDVEQSTIAHQAAYGGNVAVMRALIEEFGLADLVNQRDDSRETVFHYACGQGHVEMVRYLIGLGISPFTRSSYGTTPIDLATKGGHALIIALILDSPEPEGEQEEDEDYRYTGSARELARAIRCCLDQKHLDAVKMLYPLLHNRQVYRRREVASKRTATSVVGGYDHYFVSVKASFAEYDIHLLESSLPYPELVAFLISYSDINPSSDAGHTLISNGQDSIRPIRLHPAIVVDETNWRTMLHRACHGPHYFAQSPSAEALTTLVYTYGCDVEAKDIHGLTPLHLAAACGFYEAVMFITDCCCGSVAAVDNNGNTALHLAAGTASIAVESTSGTDSHCRHLNSDGPPVQVIRHLLQLGCDSSAKNSAGHTAHQLLCIREQQSEDEDAAAFQAAKSLLVLD